MSASTASDTRIPSHEMSARVPADLVRVSTRREVLVVAPQGVLDSSSLRALDEVVESQGTAPLVIDLSDCLLANTAVLKLLDAGRWRRSVERVCVVCTRLTGRQLIIRAGIASRLAVFGRTEDALQARVLFESGYGPGWGGDMD